MPKVVIINLASRSDRKFYLEQSGFSSSSTSPLKVDEIIWIEATDGKKLPQDESGAAKAPDGLQVFPGWQLNYDEINAVEAEWQRLNYEGMGRAELCRYYGRDVSRSEIGCFHSHWRAWQIAADESLDQDEYTIILEDDACVSTMPLWDGSLHSARWKKILSLVDEEIDSLVEKRIAWDIILLGRNQFGDDGNLVTENLREAGFSSCMHAYVVSKRGAEKLSRLDTVMPADDIVPALFHKAIHPRKDVQAFVNSLDADVKLNAYAFEEDLVVQLKTLFLSLDEEEWMSWHVSGAKLGLQPLHLLC